MTDPQSSTVHGAATKKKVHYIDNLRSSLTALVILHHAATSYGGIGRNVYQASQFGQTASPALTGFNAVNHSFFMSNFMYLGGHYSRKALDRKPAKLFIKDRLYRLGLPTVAYTLLGAPLCLALRAVWKGEDVGWQFLVDCWKNVRGAAGPVWFTATLLTFDLSMVLADKAKAFLGIQPRSSPRRAHLDQRVSTIPLVTTLGFCSAAEFFARLVYPVGRVVQPLKLQIGNLPPYIAAYIFGAWNENVEDVMPTGLGTSLCLLVSAASSLSLPQALMSGDEWMGGWNSAAAAFAVCGNFLGYAIGSSLLRFFAKFSGTPWSWINRCSYPAFLVHMPVLTALGVATDKWRGTPVQKTVVVGGVSVVLSWIFGYAGSQVLESVAQIRRSGSQRNAK